MERLYYISQGKSSLEHLQNITKVCELGIRLVQLRMKDVSFEEYLLTAQKAKAICDGFATTLIINDNIEIAKKVGVGVHLGQKDDTISKAKNVLENALIGGTANTYNECVELIQQGVDYIGLGPFRFTQTKKQLSPILGIDGYKHIVSSLNKSGYSTPIFAIGGIKNEDVATLIQTNIYGIALSGFLTNWDEKELPKELNKLTQ